MAYIAGRLSFNSSFMVFRRLTFDFSKGDSSKYEKLNTNRLLKSLYPVKTLATKRDFESKPKGRI